MSLVDDDSFGGSEDIEEADTYFEAMDLEYDLEPVWFSPFGEVDINDFEEERLDVFLDFEEDEEDWPLMELSDEDDNERWLEWYNLFEFDVRRFVNMRLGRRRRRHRGETPFRPGVVDVYTRPIHYTGISVVEWDDTGEDFVDMFGLGFSGDVSTYYFGMTILKRRMAISC